ncbi:uncharacterized protein LOC119365579 [Triticum dicoccoides]|uniref:uncharacterized protein LOC119365579 n=1 Tax=Triticum dicoccoides TaxID=85692 RepID=UPI001890931A|nr:uncharacterized protein LOC119365579 [Triticum dicoccoides]
MADVPDESATQSQAQGCGSYPFSFPSQPPDIRNWFSSYQYESPEVPELAVDPPAVDNGSETQDPLEYRVAEHSFLKHAPLDGGADLKGGCFGSQAQAEPVEVSARRGILPIGRGTVEQGTKRKQSLRGLFGAGFLDDHEEATQTEGRVVSPVQRSAVDPPWNRNWVGLQNRKRSHEGMVEYSELPTDSESTCIAETQAESRVALPVLRSAVDPPWNCNWIGLSNGKHIHEGVVEHSELLTDSEGTCIAETQENPRGGQEIYHKKRPFNCGGASLADIEEGFIEDGIEPSNLPVNSHSKGLTDAEKTEQSLPGLFEAGFLDNRDEATQTESRVVLPVLRSAVDPPWDCNWIGLRNRKRSHEGAVEDNELLTDSESTCIAETQVKPPGGQETNHTKRPVNCGGTSLAADTEEGLLEDGNKHCNLPVDSHSKGLADAEKTKQSLRGLFGAGFLDSDDEATQTESRVVSPVLRSAVDPRWNCNWIGLRNRKRSHEGGVEHSELLTDSESTCIAETQVNPPGGQQTNHSKHPVNCGGTSLAAATALEDGIEHSNLPDNFPSKGLAGSEKPKRSLRKLFGANFLDDCDEANEYETRVVSALQRNAVQPLSNCNAAGLPHIEHIHEGAVGYSELPADHEGISIAETRENPRAGWVIEHNRLPVNCGRMSLAADTEDGFLEVIEHSKPPVNSHSQVLADTEKTGIKHHILLANSNGIGSAVTEESFLIDKISRSKRKLEHKKTEETAVADGFVAIRTKVKSAEDCRTNKISKVSTGRENTTLQENRCISGTTPLGQGSTRSPMSDRTNISEVAGAPSQEISGKWKHPRKGKPNVGPPMIQLRLEQWVRRV